MFDDTNESEVIGLLTEIRDLLKNQPSSGGGGGFGDSTPTPRVLDDGGNWVWKLPPDSKPSKCKYCEQDIHWVKTKKGKNAPCDNKGVYHDCRNLSEDLPKKVEEVPF